MRPCASMGTMRYILADSSTEAFALYLWLRQRGMGVRVAPIPRGVTACCGTSVLVEDDCIDAVAHALSLPDAPAYDRIVEVERAFDAHRDRYC